MARKFQALTYFQKPICGFHRQFNILMLQRHPSELVVDVICGVGSFCGRVALVDVEDWGSVHAFGAAGSGAGVRDRVDCGAGA